MVVAESYRVSHVLIAIKIDNYEFPIIVKLKSSKAQKTLGLDPIPCGTSMIRYVGLFRSRV